MTPENPAVILRFGLASIVVALVIVRGVHRWRTRSTLLDRYREACR